MSDTRKKFDQAAAGWDEEPRRVKLAEEITAAVLGAVEIGQDMDALDYGCGTGLITLHLQPLVRSITGADTSPGMLEVLRAKALARKLENVHVTLLEPEGKREIDGRFHLIVCGMTLHHVPDVASLLREFHRLLLPGGVLALADLDTEDGSFHGNTIPAAHAGFDRGAMRAMLAAAGFRDVRDCTAATVEKDTGAGETRVYPVFLMVAAR
jgi:ubiquinone/menaquinone biosynthesis C-methylase UbiE